MISGDPRKLPLNDSASDMLAVFWKPILRTTSGYCAANVALLSGPHDAVVTVPFWPISSSWKAHITRRPWFEGGDRLTMYWLIAAPIRGSTTGLYWPAFRLLASW